MAVANTKSTLITNDDQNQPRVLNPSYLSGANLRISSGCASVAAADDDTSTYRMIRVPSSAAIYRMEVMNDAITGGTDFDLGVYKAAVNGGAVVSAALFASKIDMSTVRTLPMDAMFENLALSNCEKRLWEYLGLSADPMIDYDLVFTANTCGTAAGVLALRVYWGL